MKSKPHERRTVLGHGVDIYTGDIPFPVCQELARNGTIGVDIETTGPDRESLLQYDRGRPAIVTLQGKHYNPVIVRIDPQVRPNWLCSLLWDTGVKKIFHYARFDLSFMMHHWQVRAANVACTRMAAKFCGFESAQQSLQPQVEYFLGFKMKKGEALSDWTQPQLSDSQILYAVEDVMNLDYLLAAQLKMLEAKEFVDYQAFCDFLPVSVWYEIHGTPAEKFFQR